MLSLLDLGDDAGLGAAALEPLESILQGLAFLDANFRHCFPSLRCSRLNPGCFQGQHNWLDYYKKFGFCDLEPIKNHEAVSKYITKYVTKNMESGVTELNKNTYFHSLGLNRAPIIKKGTSLVDFDYSFENEYCRVAWLEYSEKNEEMLKQVIV